MGGHRLDYFGLGWGRLVGSCEHGTEPSCSTKCGEFLDCQNNC